MRYTLYLEDGSTKQLQRLSQDAQLAVNFGEALIYDSKDRKVYGPTPNTYVAMDAGQKARIQAIRMRITMERGL